MNMFIRKDSGFSPGTSVDGWSHYGNNDSRKMLRYVYFHCLCPVREVYKVHGSKRSVSVASLRNIIMYSFLRSL